MHALIAIAGVALLLSVLLDAFETVVLPRRVNRHFRFTAWFYRSTWRPWASITRHIKTASRRENVLGYFGPLSLIFLLGVWAIGLIFAFALMQYGSGEHISNNGGPITFGTLLYHSGETFFTLGYGDIVPTSSAARTLAVFEAGMGFAFLGLVLGYLPTIYSSFSSREIEISLLDARAGSPPTAAELLGRFGNCPDQEVLDEIFRDWERWSAEVLESQLSYPVLSFFRSQHNNQSWLGALTTILDSTALVIAGITVGIGDIRNDQARLTFAMARHAVVDLSQTVIAAYDPAPNDRLPAEEFLRLRARLSEKGLHLRDTEAAEKKLAHLRTLYEPYALALAKRLAITLPPWIHPERRRDNWEGGPWDRLIQAKNPDAIAQSTEDHF